MLSKIRLPNYRILSCQTQAGALGPRFEQHLAEFFTDLQSDLDELSPDTYTTEETGHVILLELGDNVRDLSVIGLSQKDRGLLGSIPEWMDLVELDGTRYYRFLILYNDSFGVIFYSAEDSFDAEVETWLQGKFLELNIVTG